MGDIQKLRNKDLRVFIAIWVVIFAILSVYTNKTICNVFFTVLAGLLTLTLFKPIVMKLPYLLWMFFADILGKISNFIVLFLIFYLQICHEYR